MRTSHIIASVVTFSLLAGACVRKQDVIAPAPSPVAGKGGHNALRITPQAREKNIDSCLILLKYNAIKMPDSFKYDDAKWVTQQDGRPIAKFDSLAKGDYYIYAIGWDADKADTVMGGATFKIVDTTQSTYDLYLPVFPKE